MLKISIFLGKKVKRGGATVKAGTRLTVSRAAKVPSVARASGATTVSGTARIGSTAARMSAKFGVSCVLILALTSFFHTTAFAQDDCTCPDPTNQLDCAQTQAACLQGKIAEKQQAANTLSNTLSVINGQILVQQLQIKQTQLEIAQLNTEITALSGQITSLNGSLDQLTTALIQRAQASYKERQTNPLAILFISDSVNSFFRKYKYIQVIQEHTSQVMQEAETQKTQFDQQKTLKQEKQAEVDKKNQELQDQQAQLTQQRASEQTLLQQTQDDEARYQQLLAQAQAQLSSFQSFTTSIGIGVLPPQNSPDGWYFSQRDERWANACIGNSCGTKNQADILDVGCLISSVSMILKKYGADVTPLTTAKNSSYFFSNTAYMVQPWPAPSGYSYAHTGFSEDKADSELSAGRPVIVHLRINGYDGHFIVLKSGSKGNYIMHDPAEGYDKNFTDFYRIGEIDSLAYLQKT